jgi:3-isopropylmalate dehydrogenase
MAASGNIHPGKLSLFEPVHGSSPPLAGKNVANPMGAILDRRADARAPRWSEEAARIERAVEDAVAAEQTTLDVGGRLGTRAVGDAVVSRLTSS